MRLKIDPTNPNGVSPVNENVAYVSTSTSGGSSDHSELTNLTYDTSGHTGFQPAGSYLTSETDPVFTSSEAASFVAGDAAKLAGIQDGAEVNNISDLDATDLTDSGATTLHKHSYTNLDDKPTLVTTFTGLSDTPANYTSSAGKVVAVNGAADGLEFITSGGTGTVTSVAVSGSDGIEVDSGSPITTTGTIALGVNKASLLSHINVADGAEVNVNADWNAITGDAQILNKPTIPTQYTDEMAQDAVGGMVDASLTYTDATPELKVSNPVTPAATGFTITAGTTPKTLTVSDTASVTGTNTGDQTLPTRDSLGLDTDDSPQFAGVNIGHATDTTISRVSAGVIAVEGVRIPTLSTIYPVGCIYTTTVSTNPATVFGFGTWTAFGSGKVLVGLDAGDTAFDTVEETGGASTVTLDTTMIPAHRHTALSYLSDTGSGSAGLLRANVAAGDVSYNSAGLTNETGGGLAHNNLQPYIVVYFFKRTA